jgi:hypothetical protein
MDPTSAVLDNLMGLTKTGGKLASIVWKAVF